MRLDDMTAASRTRTTSIPAVRFRTTLRGRKAGPRCLGVAPRSLATFLLAVSLALQQSAWAAPRYSLIELQSLPVGERNFALDINNFGQIVGTGSDGAYLWDPTDGMFLLGQGPGNSYVGPKAISDSGIIVGLLDESNEEICSHSFVWTTVAGVQAVCDPSYPDDGTRLFLRDVSDSGRAVGSYMGTPITWQSASGIKASLETPQAFVAGEARAVNDAGEATGTVYIQGLGDRAAFWHADGTFINLGVLGPDGKESVAWAMNDLGHVVGFVSTQAENVPFIWDAAGGMRELGEINNAETHRPRAINNLDQVVGSSSAGAWIWEPGSGMQLLTDLLDASASGWTLSSGTSVNDSGWITAQGSYRGGDDRAVLLMPLPTQTPGDTDDDGDVDLTDLNNVRNHFGELNALGDTNADGFVNLEDLNAVRNHFGATLGASAVPEPASWLIVILGMTAMSASRRCNVNIR